MILDEIKNKLKEVDPVVFYGMADDVDEYGNKITDLNYIVFMRKALSVGANRTSYSDRFTVAIIREDYIPEGLDIDVIDKMCEIAGMKLASPDCQYNYTQKPSTNKVVEILTIEFVKARKRDA